MFLLIVCVICFLANLRCISLVSSTTDFTSGGRGSLLLVMALLRLQGGVFIYNVRLINILNAAADNLVSRALISGGSMSHCPLVLIRILGVSFRFLFTFFHIIN